MPSTNLGDVVQFGVLGPLEMSIGGSLLPVGTPQRRAALAVLVINANRAVGVNTLIDAIWGRQSPDGARNTLHAYISGLRRLMSGAGVDARSVLASAPPGYRLAIGEHQHDLGRFVSEKDAGVRAAAAGQYDQASSHLSAALAQWRGPVLDDLREFGFVDALAKSLDEEKLIVQTARAEAEIVCGRADAVIGELEALTAEHTYREPLWAQLITAYYVAQRQSDALDAYRRLKTTLAEDLGIDPGPMVRALHEQILRQQPLDTRNAARVNAQDTLVAEGDAAEVGGQPVAAALRDADGQRYSLLGTATRIGRSPDNEIVLNDAKVSRHHAVISCTGSRFVITDLGSTNGVRVRGERVQVSAELFMGDRIRVGDHEFTIEVQTASSLP